MELKKLINNGAGTAGWIAEQITRICVDIGPREPGIAACYKSCIRLLELIDDGALDK